MTAYARWRKHTWGVSANQIEMLSDASWEGKWDTDKKHRKQSEAVIEFQLYREFMPGSDLSQQILDWKGSLGKKGYLYVGGAQFGTPRMYRLTGVEASNVELAGGEIVHCDIELTFTEIRSSKASKTPKRKKRSTLTYSPGGKKKQRKKKK